MDRGHGDAWMSQAYNEQHDLVFVAVVVDGTLES